MPNRLDENLAALLAHFEAHGPIGLCEPPALAEFRKQVYGSSPTPPSPSLWEWIAFMVHFSDSPTLWGGPYGPMLAGTQEDGSRFESPSREQITAECIAYWSQRMKSCRHPGIRARYADLVWQFSKQVTGQKAPIDAARIAIDAYTEAVVTNRVEPAGRASQIVPRLIELCLTVRDDDRLVNCCEQLKTHFLDASRPDRCSWRLLPFFVSLLEKVPKDKWAKLQLYEIVEHLKGVLLQPTDGGIGDLPRRKALALPLADYFRRSGNDAESRAALLHYGEAVFSACEAVNPLVAIGWLEELADHYRRFHLSDSINRITTRIVELQPAVPEQMINSSHSAQFTEEQIRDYIDAHLRPTLPQSVFALAKATFKLVETIRHELTEKDKQFPLSALFGQNIAVIDSGGRTVSKIDDENGRIMQEIVHSMQFDDLLLRFAFPELVSRFSLTADLIIAELLRAPVWDDTRRPILQRGVRAFLEGDWLVANHLLVPEFESALRNLAAQLGVVTQKPNLNGGFDLLNLDQLLRELPVEQFLGPDLIMHVRALLTGSAGLNVRNNLAHGLCPAGLLGSHVARRLMLLILLITTHITKTLDDQGSQNGSGGTANILSHVARL